MKAKTDIKEILGKNIRKYRELRGYTQEVFSELIGIGIPAISNMECGKSFPSPDTLNKIITILGIDTYMLFTDNELTDKEDVLADFQKRFNIIKENQEKFNILYGVLKILSS